MDAATLRHVNRVRGAADSEKDSTDSDAGKAGNKKSDPTVNELATPMQVAQRYLPLIPQHVSLDDSQVQPAQMIECNGGHPEERTGKYLNEVNLTPLNVSYSCDMVEHAVSAPPFLALELTPSTDVALESGTDSNETSNQSPAGSIRPTTKEDTSAIAGEMKRLEQQANLPKLAQELSDSKTVSQNHTILAEVSERTMTAADEALDKTPAAISTANFAADCSPPVGRQPTGAKRAIDQVLVAGSINAPTPIARNLEEPSAEDSSPTEGHGAASSRKAGSKKNQGEDSHRPSTVEADVRGGRNASHTAELKPEAQLQAQAGAGKNGTGESLHTAIQSAMNTSAAATQHSGKGPRAEGQYSRQASLPAFPSTTGADASVSDPTNVLNMTRITERLKGTEIKLNLHSADLGDIAIHTAMNHEKLTAQISLDHSDVGKMLADEVPNLQSKLEGQGITATIEVRQQTQSFSGEAGHSHSQPYKPQQPPSFPFQEHGIETAVTLAPVVWERRVDIRV